MKRSTLLELDGVGNVALGVPLLVAPAAVADFLGLPPAGSTLFPVVLGAVFFGIGVALLVERYKPSWSGLGLGGATSINLVFGLALIAWLSLAEVALSTRGAIVLWGLAALLVGISALEIVSLQRGISPDRPRVDETASLR